MTKPLYRDDAYQTSATATVLAITERGGIVLDQSIFYPTSGGQPGDAGVLSVDGIEYPIATTVYDADRKTIVHVPAPSNSEPEAPLHEPRAPLPKPGANVTLTLDWAKRHQQMRIHSALHLLCSLVPFAVTGGQIGQGDGRLDFDVADAGALDKDALNTQLNALIDADHPITTRWITDGELDANPDLVRTMSVKPPMGSGQIRLVAIGNDAAIDLQPCGGTHTKSTSEIGRLSVTKIEKKGKQNRRVRIAFA